MICFAFNFFPQFALSYNLPMESINTTVSTISTLLSSNSSSNISDVNERPAHCTRGSLTSSYGWMIQGILAGLAFTSLIIKRFCEPKNERRSWTVWFFDTSKQALAALVIHFINILMAEFFGGVDPCTQYIISFVLDSTVGLLIIYVGVILTQFVAKSKGSDMLSFGDYGKPYPKVEYWYHQTVAYICIAIVAKVIVSILLQAHFWVRVQEILLWPIPNQEVEIILVILIIPFFVNVFLFWVTDNILTMSRSLKRATQEGTSNGSDSIVWFFIKKILWLPIALPAKLILKLRSLPDDRAGLMDVSLEQNPFASPVV